MRVAFAALICAIAIGAFVAELWFLDFFGPSAVAAGLPLLSLAIVGSLLVLRRVGGPIGWLLGTAGALLELVLLLQAYGSTSLEPALVCRGARSRCGWDPSSRSCRSAWWFAR